MKFIVSRSFIYDHDFFRVWQLVRLVFFFFLFRECAPGTGKRDMEKLQFHIYADVCGGIRNKILYTSVFGPSKKIIQSGGRDNGRIACEYFVKNSRMEISSDDETIKA